MTKKCLFTIILIFLTTSLVLSEEKELIIGGENGWNNFSVARDVSISNSGRFGKQAVEIASNTAKLNTSTDLLLDFENIENTTDSTGKYSVASTNLSATTQSIMGKYSALGKGNTGGIELTGNANSIFGKEGLVGSFTISFWLNPSLAENGETVFLWDSSRNVNNNPVYQLISIMFFQNRLEWNFTNIFSDYHEFKDITLKSRSLVIPDVWAHHSLSYDDATGIVEYRINGRIEALTYATSSGYSERELYSVILGTPANIAICSNYTGRIDDFIIKEEFSSGNFENYQYNPNGGYFETQPLGPFPYGSTIQEITTLSDIPTETDIQFFVRAGDNFYEWTDEYPTWVPISTLKDNQNVQGRFFQVAASLHTDGKGIKTPSITEIRLKYNEAEAPLAPYKVFADAGNGYIDLSWIPAAGIEPDGYIVYYGESPGEYLGENSMQGDSPIDVGQTDSFRISGLKNGKAYYFAVTAYSYTPKKVEGIFSHEVYARPLQGGR